MYRCFIIAFINMTTTLGLAADSGYRLPPQDVVDIIAAPPEPSVSFSPDGKWLLLIERDAMPGIQDLARRKLQLAGIRIDPAANSPFRVDFGRALTLRRRDDETLIKLPLPKDARLASVSWSHNSRAFVYTLATDRGSELWGATVERTATPRRLTDRLSTVLGGVDWLSDGKQLICRLTPEKRGSEPAAPLKPLGPSMQESSGNFSPARTFQDLLATPYDEALFEHHATTQLAVIDLEGKLHTIGQPAMIDSAEPSPDGRHLLVTAIKRPFSYTLPYSAFPKEIVVWSLNGGREHLVADVPMEENIPIEGVRTGPRSVTWTSSDAATLAWFEALDGGDPRAKAAHRDRLMTIAAPFSDPPRELTKIEHRATSVSFFQNPALAAVTEFDRDRRWVRTLLHDWREADKAPKVLADRSIRDAYGDQGDMVMVRNPQGHAIARQDDGWVYLAGAGASPQGFLPFLDRRNLETLTTERLWRCEPGYLESVALIAASTADARPQIITRQESSTSPQNYLLRDLQRNTSQRLTEFRDPTPQIRGIRKELVKYQRPDGVPLSATLYLPANYQPGTRLPLFVWAYPVEFSDAGTAGQVTSSPAQFTRMRGASHLTLLTQGYAVLDNATMPVVGSPETMNDTFVEQIVASAQAAIDKAVEMGVADRRRVGVGGHSYGGFMTANLLAHCDLFRAGIARSGAYNRTLTPFGFQSERRPFWQAKEVYMNVSPFTHADKIKEPLLLIHGENDNNAGTFPLQSQRMYQAVKGNGGTVRLVMLPHESHGYAARESVLHTQAEMIEWLNRHVRDAPVSESETR
jgi:dipeptidyl aminopeptidase/acylaminoacyl peptidase